MTMLEKAARAIAHSDYEARLSVIRASQSTDSPISCPGAFDGMDYLIREEAWEAADERLKEPYRRQARAVLMAVREPLESEIADLQEVYEVSFAATFKLRYRDMIDAILSEEPA